MPLRILCHFVAIELESEAFLLFNASDPSAMPPTSLAMLHFCTRKKKFGKKRKEKKRKEKKRKKERKGKYFTKRLVLHVLCY